MNKIENKYCKIKLFCKQKGLANNIKQDINNNILNIVAYATINENFFSKEYEYTLKIKRQDKNCLLIEGWSYYEGRHSSRAKKFYLTIFKVPNRDTLEEIKREREEEVLGSPFDPYKRDIIKNNKGLLVLTPKLTEI